MQNSNLQEQLGRLRSNVGLAFYKLVIWINIFLEKMFGIGPRGLGFFGKLVTESFYQEMPDGAILYIDHRFIGSYYKNILGLYNEEDTYQFLIKIFAENEGCTFIDIGANVGEMTLQAYRDPNVHMIHSFEPNPNCLHIVRKGVERTTAGFNGIQIQYHEHFLSDTTGSKSIAPNTKRTRDVSIFDTEFGGHSISIVPLDKMELTILGKLIIKIDVEGAELLVIKGSQKTIETHRPVIIFEYNHRSRKYFTLDKVREALPIGYEIFRLSEEGALDTDLQSTYNCVAVPQ